MWSRRWRLPERDPVVRIRPENQILDIGFELTEPVRRVAGDDDDVPLGDSTRNTPLDSRAPETREMALSFPCVAAVQQG